MNSDLVGRLSSVLELVLTRCRNRHNFSTFSIAAKVRLCLASLRWQLPRRAGMAGCRCCQNSAPDGPIASHGNDMATAVYGSVTRGSPAAGRRMLENRTAFVGKSLPTRTAERPG
jgi:hypothetical protein